MTVAEASERTGLPARNIRFYDRQGLVSPPRSDNGYRAYTDVEVEELRLVARARHVGLSIDECRGLLDWWRLIDGPSVLVTGYLTDAETACRALRTLRASEG